MFTHFAALNCIRTVGAICAFIVALIQIKVPNRNLFVLALSIAIDCFFVLRIGTSFAFSSADELTANVGWCWTNFALANYFVMMEHFLAWGVATALWFMVRNRTAWERYEKKVFAFTVLFPVVPTVFMITAVVIDMKSDPSNPGPIAVRVDRCSIVKPVWTIWAGLLVWDILSVVGVLVFTRTSCQFCPCSPVTPVANLAYTISQWT